jgi:predicted site-specific integrase-resolvase
MPSTNGHGPKRAILYVRVSTDEQARSGYSLAQQTEASRAYAAREGYEVLEEVSDPGQSGANLERPGMDRVRGLVAAGGVYVVLAQDRDRFAREPAYHYLLRREFEEHGTKIRALNDRGDDSPEGELTDGIFDQLGMYVEQERIPTPGGGKCWDRAFFRVAILDDVYRPHTYKEVMELVSPEVATRLDPEQLYGIWWYNRLRVRTRQVSGPSENRRHYRTEAHFTEKPKEEWVAVPVPYAGIPLETVDAARAAIKDNRRPSNAGRRFWELSNGILRCGTCDHSTVAAECPGECRDALPPLLLLPQPPPSRRRRVHEPEALPNRGLGGASLGPHLWAPCTPVESRFALLGRSVDPHGTP